MTWSAKVLLACLVGLGLIPVSLAQETTTEQTPTSAPDMTFEEFKPRAVYQKDRGHHFKRENCRAHDRYHFPKPLSEVAPSWRSEFLARWRAKKEWAKSQSSTCLSDFLWRWFHSGYSTKEGMGSAECIKSEEGAWTSNTGNGYYGGFQADLSFQQTYGPEYYPPTANYWPPIAQIHMAWRGWKARGWHPWPTTARICGLL